MARDGNGIMSIPYPDFVAGTTIISSQVEANFSTIVDEISNSIAADGQTAPTANLSMGGFKLTGLGAASAAADSVRLRDVQEQAWAWAGTAGGTANALELTVAPALTAYAAGQAVRFIAAADNSGPATADASSLGAKEIRHNGAALAGGEIKNGGLYEIVYDGTQFQLLSIATVAPSDFIKTLMDDPDAATARATLGALAQPGSSTDNAVARYNGAGGEIQNSANGPFVDDNGRLIGPDSVTLGGSIGLNQPPNNDLNDVTGQGWYTTNNLTANRPVGGDFWRVITVGPGNVVQLAIQSSVSNSGLLAVRDIISGNANAWRRLLTELGKATLTGGFDATEHDAGTKSSGTFTPDPADGNFQKAVNGGAHTLAPPGKTCTIVIQYTNNASAGTITISGFTAVDGDSLTTTDGHDFLLFITEVNGFKHLNVKALQ